MAEDPALAKPVHPDAPLLAAEVVYAATHEGAVRLEDVLLRRTRLAFVTRDGGRRSAAAVADLVGEVLGWDAERRRSEVEAFEVVAPRLPPAQVLA